MIYSKWLHWVQWVQPFVSLDLSVPTLKKRTGYSGYKLCQKGESYDYL